MSNISEFAKSFGLLLWGIIRKWIFLLFAAIDLTQIFDFVGIPMIIPYPLNWIIFWVLLGLAIVGAYHDLRMTYLQLENKIKTELDYAKSEAKRIILEDFRKPPLNKIPNILADIEVIMRHTAESEIEGYKIDKEDLSNRTSKYRKMVESHPTYKARIDELKANQHAIGDSLLDNDITTYLGVLFEVYDHQFFVLNNKQDDWEKQIFRHKGLEAAHIIIGKARTKIAHRIEILLTLEDKNEI
jgi:hypothetical protein